MSDTPNMCYFGAELEDLISAFDVDKYTGLSADELSERFCVLIEELASERNSG